MDFGQILSIHSVYVHFIQFYCVDISAGNALYQALEEQGFNGTVFSNVFPDIIRIQGLIGD